MLIQNHSHHHNTNPIPFSHHFNTTDPPHRPPQSHNTTKPQQQAKLQLTPEFTTDLRRRRNRDIAETIVRRAEHLEQHEKQLILSIYAHGLSTTELAPLTNKKPRTLRRQLRNILKRLTSPEYLYTIRHQTNWTTTRKRVANACFIQGQSLRAAAATLNLTLHTVRKHHQHIRALATAENQP